MMKFTLFVVFGIVAVLSSGVSAELSDAELQHLLTSLQEVTAVENLSCGGEQAYCQNNSQGLIPSPVCLISLRLYLCRNVRSVDDLREALKNIPSGE